MILPRVKSIVQNQGFFAKPLVFEGVSEVSHKAVYWMKLFVPEICSEIGSEATVSLVEKEELKPGAYGLHIDSEEIAIYYRDEEGVRNAVATLTQLVTEQGIRSCDVTDEPDNEFRSCMLDLARGYVEISVLKEHTVRMALLKFNRIHLHLMDRQSYVLESEVVPNPGKHRQYTKKEMSEFAEFCRELCIEVIPEIEIPSHAVNQLKALPELACEIIDKRFAVDIIKNAKGGKRELIDDKRGVSAWVVCAGNERTYEIYDGIIREICEVFKDSEYIHIGGDELEYRFMGAHAHWENCVKCQQRMKEEGLNSIRELYYYVIRRMHGIVSSFGRKMMMWNDQLDVTAPINIPKDILVEYWSGTVIDKESTNIYQKLLDQGFKTVNARIKYTYVNLPTFMKESEIGKWNVRVDALGESELEGDIVGGEMCAWELGNPLYSFYPRSLPVCMALFSDRVWNNETVEYGEEYRNSVFGVLLGDWSCTINPFFCFSEMIPPRDKAKAIFDDIDLDSISKEQLGAVIEYLNGLRTKNIYGVQARDAYIEFLELLYDVI